MTTKKTVKKLEPIWVVLWNDGDLDAFNSDEELENYFYGIDHNSYSDYDNLRVFKTEVVEEYKLPLKFSLISQFKKVH